MISGAVGLGVLLLPYAASAQQVLFSNGSNQNSTFGLIAGFLNALIGLFITLAIIVFFWGLITYLTHLGDDTKRKAGLMVMTYGVIALFVMVSIWGILRLLQNTFQVQNGNVQSILPLTVPTSSF